MKKMNKVLTGVVLILVGVVISTIGTKAYDNYVRWEQSDNYFQGMKTLDNFHKINDIIDDLKNENKEHIQGIEELEEYRDELIKTIKEYEKLIINRDDAINELHGVINQRDNTINELTKELQDLTLKHEQAIKDMGSLTAKIERLMGMSNYPRYESYIFTEIEIYFNGAKTKHKFHGDIEESFIRDVNNIGYFTRKNVIGDMVMINPSQCGVIKISKFKGNALGIKQKEEQQ